MLPRHSCWVPWRRVLPGLLAALSVGAGATPPRDSLPPLPFPYTHAQTARPFPKARPGERVLLTLDGATRKERLTLTQLRALPTVKYASTQPQLQKSFVYEGVTLLDLARRGGFAGRDVRVYAQDGFVTTIAARDYQTAPVMIAFAANGKPISVLDKGPLLVVFPHDPLRFPQRLYGRQWAWFASRVAPAR